MTTKNTVKTHLFQARRHSTLGDRGQALDSIRKALSIDPGEIVITEVLISMERAGNTLDPQDDDNDPIAVESTERITTTDMDSKLEKIFRLSDEALASGNDSKALAYLKKAAELFPDEPEVNQKLLQLKSIIRAGNLVKIGSKKLSEGDVKKAISAARKAFDLLPDVNGLDDLLERLETAESDIPELEPVIEPTIKYKEVIEEKKVEKKTMPDSEALLWADRIRTAVQDDNFEEAGNMVAEAVRRHPDDTLLNSFYSKLKRLGFVKVI